MIEDKLTLIIISWKDPDLVNKVIENLYSCKSISEMIIIYNGPLSGSPNQHREKINPNWVFKYHINKRNYGFAPSVNIASKLATKKFLFLHNYDAIIHPAELDRLVFQTEKAMNKGFKIGAVNPLVCFYGTKKVQHSGWSLNLRTGRMKAHNFNMKSEKIIKELKIVDSCSGELFLAPRDVFNKLNGFKANLFAYWEETEYCIRLKKNGYVVGVFTDISGYHMVSSSVGDNTPLKFYLLFRNKLWLFLKYHRDTTNLPLFTLIYCRDFILKFLSLVKRKRISKLVVLALIDGLFNFEKPLTNTIKQLIK